MDTTMHDDISHCLRTPLTSVLGYATTLMDRWDGLDELTRLEIVRVIYSEALRMSHSVESIDRLLYDHVADRHQTDQQTLAIAPFTGPEILPNVS